MMEIERLKLIKHHEDYDHYKKENDHPENGVGNVFVNFNCIVSISRSRANHNFFDNFNPY